MSIASSTTPWRKCVAELESRLATLRHDLEAERSRCADEIAAANAEVTRRLRDLDAREETLRRAEMDAEAKRRKLDVEADLAVRKHQYERKLIEVSNRLCARARENDPTSIIFKDEKRLLQVEASHIRRLALEEAENLHKGKTLEVLKGHHPSLEDICSSSLPNEVTSFPI
jgi:hypothetical protein